MRIRTTLKLTTPIHTILLTILFCISLTFATDIIPQSPNVFEYEEIPVTVSMNNSWNFDAFMLKSGDVLFFDVSELFISLEIPYEENRNKQEATGYIEKKNRTFQFDFDKLTIDLDGISHQLSSSDLLNIGTWYISSTALSEIFGIHTEFEIRHLKVKLKADFELPRFKEMRLLEMRKNLQKLKGEEFVADTVAKRERHFWKAGMLDWKGTFYQILDGNFANVLSFDWGSELLYGAFNISASFSDQYKFVPQDLLYDWHWVDNDNKIVRQVLLGKYDKNSLTASKQLMGGEITNRPTTVRKTGGSYTISDKTTPNRTVELYINDKLVDYIVADASGFYLFEVPLVYGTSNITIISYGSSGEEKIEKENYQIPYMLLRRRAFEYNISGGIVPTYDSLHVDPLTKNYTYLKQNNLANSPWYAILNMNYGLTRFMTLSGGIEYSTDPSLLKYSQLPIDGKYAPFAMVTIQPASWFTLSGSYHYLTSASGNINLKLPASIYLTSGYKRNLLPPPDSGSFIIDNISGTLRKSFKGNISNTSFGVNYNNSRFLHNQMTHTMQLTGSNFIRRFSSSASLRGVVNDSLFSKWGTAGVSFSFKHAISLSANTELDLDTMQISSISTGFNAAPFKGRLSANYTHSFATNTHSASLNYSRDFPVVRTRVGVTTVNKFARVVERIEGSFAFAGDKHVKVNERYAVNNAGITFRPYVDKNYNKNYDDGEELLNTPILFDNAYKARNDSISRIGLVKAHTTVDVELAEDALENYSWKLPYKKWKIYVDPNQYKTVMVPVQIYGEVTGSVRGLLDYVSVETDADTTLDLMYKNTPVPDPVMIEPLLYFKGKPVRYTDYYAKYGTLFEDNPDAIIHITTPDEAYYEKDGVPAYFMRTEIYQLHVAQAKMWAQNIKEYFIHELGIDSSRITIDEKPNDALYSSPLMRKHRGKVVAIAVENVTKLFARVPVEKTDTYERIEKKTPLVGFGSGIKLEVYDKNKTKVADFVTDYDGRFSYLGLEPGDYTITVSKEQRERLGLKLYPDEYPFSVKQSREGDYISEKEFIMIDETLIKEVDYRSQ